MISRRNFILRLSICFNIVVILYVATHIGSGGEEPAAEASNLQSSSGRNLASIDSVAEAEDAGPTPAAAAIVRAPEARCPNVSASNEVRPPASPTPPPTSLQPPPPSLAEMLGCSDRRPSPRYLQRVDHWVLVDYIRATKRFSCAESVTYTTHGDYSFLDNLPPLLERWKGPVSLALFAPGEDFAFTLSAVSYARSCLSPLVRELVTFHLYFGVKDIPSKVPRPDSEDFPTEFDCAGRPPPPPWGSSNGTANYVSYKSRKNLLYPVNVGRNIAREAAATHYVLPSDIELYPSPGLIGDFLDLMRREKEAEMNASMTSNGQTPDNRTQPSVPVRTPVRRVYVLPIFEIAANMSQPETKMELVRMLKNGSAIPFHKKLCAGCHAVPKAKEWEEKALEEGEEGERMPMAVFHVGKRLGSYYHWEPIFIGTDYEPPYDERLSWEGKSDKMTQGYALCALDYEFRILDRAFLVHRPGIKSYKKDPKRSALAAKTNALIKKVIGPELKVLYGTRKGCVV